jgi:surface antigen
MATLSLRWLCVVAAGLIAAPAISSAAGGYGAIQSMPAGYFDKQDLSLLETAVVGVLEDENAEATRSWNNSKNGHSGTVTSLRAFRSADGRPCKKVQIDSSAEGYKSSMKYDVCLHQDGNWREAESGVPFGKARSPKATP